MIITIAKPTQNILQIAHHFLIIGQQTESHTSTSLTANWFSISSQSVLFLYLSGFSWGLNILTKLITRKKIIYHKSSLIQKMSINKLMRIRSTRNLIRCSSKKPIKIRKFNNHSLEVSSLVITWILYLWDFRNQAKMRSNLVVCLGPFKHRVKWDKYSELMSRKALLFKLNLATTMVIERFYEIVRLEEK